MDLAAVLKRMWRCAETCGNTLVRHRINFREVDEIRARLVQMRFKSEGTSVVEVDSQNSSLGQSLTTAGSRFSDRQNMTHWLEKVQAVNAQEFARELGETITTGTTDVRLVRRLQRNRKRFLRARNTSSTSRLQGALPNTVLYPGFRIQSPIKLGRERRRITI